MATPEVGPECFQKHAPFCVFFHGHIFFSFFLRFFAAMCFLQVVFLSGWNYPLDELCLDIVS